MSRSIPPPSAARRYRRRSPVGVVPAYRLHRDLADHGRVEAGLEHAPVGAQRIGTRAGNAPAWRMNHTVDARRGLPGSSGREVSCSRDHCRTRRQAQSPLRSTGAPPTGADRRDLRWSGDPIRYPDGGAATSRAGEPCRFHASPWVITERRRCGPTSQVSPIRPPQRLAPYSYAVGAEVQAPGCWTAGPIPRRRPPCRARFRRSAIILLYDLEGHGPEWHDPPGGLYPSRHRPTGHHPMLPEVAWAG